MELLQAFYVNMNKTTMPRVRGIIITKFTSLGIQYKTPSSSSSSSSQTASCEASLELGGSRDIRGGEEESE
jgi:hypothetical protein